MSDKQLCYFRIRGGTLCHVALLKRVVVIIKKARRATSSNAAVRLKAPPLAGNINEVDYKKSPLRNIKRRSATGLTI
jgi:hypothetical protein